jgi:hypothetical protein
MKNGVIVETIMISRTERKPAFPIGTEFSVLHSENGERYALVTARNAAAASNAGIEAALDTSRRRLYAWSKG